VRDILFVDDLVEAFLLADRHVERLSGQAFNIGGGPDNVISLLDLLKHIERLDGKRPRIEAGGWRTGDQRYYVSDIRRFREATGWAPRIGAAEGIERLHRWLREMREAAPAGLATDLRTGWEPQCLPAS
jgi:CDP-paratose 2-epimerase